MEKIELKTYRKHYNIAETSGVTDKEMLWRLINFLLKRVNEVTHNGPFVLLEDIYAEKVRTAVYDSGGDYEEIIRGQVYEGLEPHLHLFEFVINVVDLGTFQHEKHEEVHLKLFNKYCDEFEQFVKHANQIVLAMKSGNLVELHRILQGI